VKTPFHTRRLKKIPYAQNVAKLVQEYEISEIKIAKPCYETITDISPINIDTTLTGKVDKSKSNTENIVVANLHLLKKYADYHQIFTDGSKDPDVGLAGAAL
jgi:hypothetical protein